MNNNNIVILLSTWNGEKYLQEQLDSLNSQTYQGFKIIARDDMSSDNTLQILKKNNIEILKASKNLGAKKSFSVLLEYALNNTEYEYIMFCDQDDVWETDKIKKTLDKIKQMEEIYGKIPLLVHTNLKVVDECLNNISDSFWSYEGINPYKNDINRLLLQNTVTGCTVMINRKLAELVQLVPHEAIMHDWWIAMVASEFGKIGILSDTTIQYRQHGSNDTGAQSYNFVKYVYKKIMNYQDIGIDNNILQAKAFLKTYKNTLDRNTITILEEFSSIKQKPFWYRRKILVKSRLLKQGFIRNVGLFLLA